MDSFFNPQPNVQIAGTLAAAVWGDYQRLTQSQWLSPTELQTWQRKRLGRLLRHCVSEVPYYRGRFDGLDIDAEQWSSLDELRKLPLLDRATYAKNAERLVADSLPPGTRVVGSLKTSGTTGIPVLVRNTNTVVRNWLTFSLRDLEWCQLDPRQQMAAIRFSGKTGNELQSLMKGVALPHWGQELSAIVQNGRSYYLDSTADPKYQLSWLHQVNPDYLTGYPSSVEYLARLIVDQEKRPWKLRRIQLLSEQITPQARQVIREAFGATVLDVYSCSEAGYVASPCPAGHGYHVHAENVILELLNERDEPCLPGEVGRIVLTTLHNLATPFVRYEIADEAVFGPNPCPCGRGLPLLSEIRGRIRPMFKLANGLAKHSMQLVVDVREIGGFLQFQIVQDSLDQVLIRLVPNSQWSEVHQQQIRSVFEGFFEGLARIDIQCVPSIPIPPSGKLQSTVINC
jgi:phenylacetate-CoA ligase